MNDQTADRWDVQLEDAAPAKRGVPVWVWGCGGGCLLLLVVAMLATWWFADKLMTMFGPEAAWPEVAEVMPYAPDGSTQDVVEARPPGYTPMRFPITELAKWFGEEEPTVEGSVALSSLLVVAREQDPNYEKGTGLAVMAFVFDGLLEGDPIEQVTTGFGWKESAVEGESGGQMVVEFQGVQTDAFHMRVDPEQPDRFLPGGADAQSILFLDVTGSRQRTVVLGAFATGTIDATVGEVELFLQPFRVWEGK